MSEREIVKKYEKGELTILWKPKICIHAAICVQMLPDVYNPNEKPWINAENASMEALKSQISKCPSGALTYEMKDEKGGDNSTVETKVQVTANGPLLVQGALEVTGTDGSITKKSRTTAFCRCGASSNKPFCDGAHNSINFSG